MKKSVSVSLATAALSAKVSMPPVVAVGSLSLMSVMPMVMVCVAGLVPSGGFYD